MSIIQSLSSDLLIHHRYRGGDYLDKSGNGNDGVPTSMHWSKRNRGVGIGNQSSPTGFVTVTDAAELRSTSGTLVFLGDFSVANVAAVNRALYSKRDAGGVHLQLHATQTQLQVYDGTSTCSLTHTINQNEYIAVTYSPGAAAIGYVDGVLIGSFSTTLTPTGDDADIIIGNIYDGTLPVEWPIYEFLHFDVILTADQIRLLYEELAVGRVVTGTQKSHFTQYNYVAHWNFDKDEIWEKGTGWTIASHKASCDGTQVDVSNLTQDVGEVGQVYTVEFSISNYTLGGGISAIAGTATGAAASANGVYFTKLTAATTGDLGLQADENFVGNIDYVKVTKGALTVYENSFNEYPVTLGDALGETEPLADWTVQTGTWKIAHDSTGRHLLCVTDGRVTTPLRGASGLTTHTFSKSGAPTLTKNTNDLQLDAVAGEKIYSIILTT